MQRKLLECYCKEVLGIKQEILSYEAKGNEVYIMFLYDENYIYQDSIFISMLGIISFVFNRV